MKNTIAAAAAAVQAAKPPLADFHEQIWREQIWLVQATVSHVLRVPLGDLCAATRRRPQAAFARQLAMYLCHIVFEIGISQAARAFGRDPSTVTYALHRIEEMRDDAEFDTTLTTIETMLIDTWKAAA